MKREIASINRKNVQYEEDENEEAPAYTLKCDEEMHQKKLELEEFSEEMQTALGEMQ